MRTTLLVLILATSVVRAEPDTQHRDAWRAVFVGAVAFGVVGAGTWIYGAHEVGDATQKLCDGGAYGTTSSCQPAGPMINQSQVAQLNDQGTRGHNLTLVGAASVVLATGVAGIAFYEGFVVRPTRDVVIAPMVSPTTAGAALALTW